MYVKVYLSIKTTQKGKIVNRLVKTEIVQFSDETTKQDILDFFTDYHRRKKQHVSSCTGLELGGSEILWQGHKLAYFIRVTVGGVIVGEGEATLVKDIVTAYQEKELEAELRKVDYM
jgi:hypothetical protein